MNFSEPKNISYTSSLILHILLALLFLFVTINPEVLPDEYITIGFGSGGNIGSAGATGKSEVVDDNKPKPENVKQQTAVQKKVDLPETINKDTENLIATADKKKETEETPVNRVKPLQPSTGNTRGSELEGEGDSGFGFDLDFGGKGKRRIYSFILPEYPEGVSKEIDVKLRFTILPDGSVGRIFPLIKADARLELAAINSLRQWRFEPLPRNSQQIEQTVVITFPYRLQ